MKRIGLTQRVEIITSYQERRDCLDQSWTELLLELGLMPIPLPNIKDEKTITEYVHALKLDGVILTGGNDLAYTNSSSVAIERDLFETALVDYCIDHNLPVLGVCRGMQMLNVFFGGQLLKVEGHVTASHDITFSSGQKYAVNSYHDWGISDDALAVDLIAQGHSVDGLVEYCHHKNLPIVAMMWHPERANVDPQKGKDIINEVFHD